MASEVTGAVLAVDLEALGAGSRGAPSVAMARVVLLTLADYAHPDGSGACPSMGTLSAAAGAHKRTVQRVVRWLQRAGLLADCGVSRDYGTRTWTLTIPGLSAPRGGRRHATGGWHGGDKGVVPGPPYTKRPIDHGPTADSVPIGDPIVSEARRQARTTAAEQLAARQWADHNTVRAALEAARGTIHPNQETNQ